MEKKSYFKIVDGSFYTFHINRYGKEVNFLPCRVSIHCPAYPFICVYPFESSRLQSKIIYFTKNDIDGDYIVLKTEYGVLKVECDKKELWLKEPSKEEKMKKNIEEQKQEAIIKEQEDKVIEKVRDFLKQVYIDPKLVLTKKERGKLLRTATYDFINSLLMKIIVDNVEKEHFYMVSQRVARKMFDEFEKELLNLKFVHDLNK